MENLDFDAIVRELNVRTENTLMKTLGITYTRAGENFLEATMPVNETVHQPYGLLHGGASMALAESVGSAASHMFARQKVLGLEFSANHLKTLRSGVVTARAEAIHLGRRTHLWSIRITDQDGRLISQCKLTNIVLEDR
ncbi:MAG: hotdog fold thioesterase [Cryomorphaceae bacterium]|nr:hotdog fold thioesterase [Cryomorphaceae bacterium]